MAYNLSNALAGEEVSRLHIWKNTYDYVAWWNINVFEKQPFYLQNYMDVQARSVQEYIIP